MQQQNLAPTINQRVVAQYMKERAMPAPVTRPELTAYATLVTRGALTWKHHVDIVSVREGWDVRTGGVCCRCGQPNSRIHVLGSCPLKLVAVGSLYATLLLYVQNHVPQWNISACTGHGLRVCYGGKLFGIALGSGEGGR